MQLMQYQSTDTSYCFKMSVLYLVNMTFISVIKPNDLKALHLVLFNVINCLSIYSDKCVSIYLTFFNHRHTTDSFITHYTFHSWKKKLHYHFFLQFVFISLYINIIFFLNESVLCVMKSFVIINMGKQVRLSPEIERIYAVVYEFLLENWK